MWFRIYFLYIVMMSALAAASDDIRSTFFPSSNCRANDTYCSVTSSTIISILSAGIGRRILPYWNLDRGNMAVWLLYMIYCESLMRSFSDDLKYSGCRFIRKRIFKETPERPLFHLPFHCNKTIRRTPATYFTPYLWWLTGKCRYYEPASGIF